MCYILFAPLHIGPQYVAFRRQSFSPDYRRITQQKSTHVSQLIRLCCQRLSSRLGAVIHNSAGGDVLIVLAPNNLC